MSAATIHELTPTTRTAPSTPAERRPGLPRQRSAPTHLTLVPEVQRAAGPALQLTRRGRLVVLVALMALGAVLALALSGLVGGAAAGTAPSRPPTRTIVVHPGQTLWSIAGDIAPGVDPRDTIARIVELNALPTTDVAAGTRLAVPTR